MQAVCPWSVERIGAWRGSPCLPHGHNGSRMTHRGSVPDPQMGRGCPSGRRADGRIVDPCAVRTRSDVAEVVEFLDQIGPAGM